MRGSVLGLPLWLILAVCVVPPIAYSLSRAAAVPVELILPTAVAMEVVFLTQTVQQALRRAEVRRHFGFALWELHQELSQHLESLDRRLALVRQGVNSEPNLDSLRTWASSVDAFAVDAWLAEVPSRLAVLTRDIQHVLRDLGHMPGVIISGDDEKRLAIVDHRDT